MNDQIKAWFIERCPRETTGVDYTVTVKEIDVYIPVKAPVGGTTLSASPKIMLPIGILDEVFQRDALRSRDFVQALKPTVLQY